MVGQGRSPKGASQSVTHNRLVLVWFQMVGATSIQEETIFGPSDILSGGMNSWIEFASSRGREFTHSQEPKNPRVRAAFTISLSCVWRWSESSNPSIWTRMALVSGRHLGRRCAGSCERCIPRMARFNIGLLEVGLLSPWVRWRWDTAATYTWMVLAWSILLRWVANKMTVCWDPGRGVCPCVWQKERYLRIPAL